MDDTGIPVDDFQAICNNMCYTYIRSTTAVSLSKYPSTSIDNGPVANTNNSSACLLCPFGISAWSLPRTQSERSCNSAIWCWSEPPRWRSDHSQATQWEYQGCYVVCLSCSLDLREGKGDFLLLLLLLWKKGDFATFDGCEGNGDFCYFDVNKVDWFASDMGLVFVDVDGHETFGLGAVFLNDLEWI